MVVGKKTDIKNGWTRWTSEASHVIRWLRLIGAEVRAEIRRVDAFYPGFLLFSSSPDTNTGKVSIRVQEPIESLLVVCFAREVHVGTLSCPELSRPGSARAPDLV